MRYYELTYLISPNFSEIEMDSLKEEINSLIEEKEGKIINKTDLIKRGVAGFPQKEAYLMSLNFRLNPENISDIEKKLKSKEEIINYLIIAKKEPREEKDSEILFKKPEKSSRPKKVELKEIEQKLEEILGQ